MGRVGLMKMRGYLDVPFFHGVPDQVRGLLEVQFPDDEGPVRLHRADAYQEDVRYLPVGFSFRDQLEYFLFAWCQRLGRARAAHRGPAREARGHVDISLPYALDGAEQLP